MKEAITKLVKLINAQKWKEVRLILQKKHNSIVEQIERGVDQCQNDLNLLSIACSYNAPHDIIEILLTIDPESASLLDEYQMLPLHIACLVGAHSESIRVLLNHDFLTAKAVDDFDRTPIHYSMQFICEPIDPSDSFACSNHSEVDSSTHSRQSSIHSRQLGRGWAANASNHNSVDSGNNEVSPMTISKFHDCLYTVHLLLSACPEVINFHDEEGRTPTDITQDYMANNSSNSKGFERADITCKLLRKKAVDLYIRQKEGWETRDGSVASRTTGPTPASGFDNVSIVSGFINLSILEISSLNQMDFLSDDESLHGRPPLSS